MPSVNGSPCSTSHQFPWPSLYYLRKCCLFVHFPPSSYKLLCFCLFLCSTASWAAWIHLSITSHTTFLSHCSSPGPHSHSLLTLTSVVAFCPLLILQLGLSTCFVRKLPSAQYRNLPDSLSLHVLSQQTLGQFIYLAPTKSQPSTRKLQTGYTSTDSKANVLAFDSWCFCTAVLFEKEGSKTERCFSYLSLYSFLFLLLLVKNSNHCQIDLKQQIYFSCSAARCQRTFTTQKNSSQRLVCWWVLAIVFHSRRPYLCYTEAAASPLAVKALYGFLENLHGDKKLC